MKAVPSNNKTAMQTVILLSRKQKQNPLLDLTYTYWSASHRTWKELDINLLRGKNTRALPKSLNLQFEKSEKKSFCFSVFLLNGCWSQWEGLQSKQDGDSFSLSHTAIINDLYSYLTQFTWKGSCMNSQLAISRLCWLEFSFFYRTLRQ